jgi:hypothetical protein
LPACGLLASSVSFFIRFGTGSPMALELVADG